VTEDRFEKLLEAYSLEDLLELAGLEVVEVLVILDEQGYLQDIQNLPEPL
jgi:hypothetical protein